MSSRSRCSVWPLAAALVLAIACASSGAGAHRSCADAPIDPAFLAGGPVYRDCQVDRQARRVSGGDAPDFRPSRMSGCMEAELQFVVDETGAPVADPVRVVHATDMDLARALVAAEPSWRFAPAMKDGRAVRQLVDYKVVVETRVTSTRGGAPMPPQSTGHCP